MAKSVKKPGNATSTPAKPRRSTVKKKTRNAPVVEIPASHDEIAELAHHYWIEGGCQHGRDADDWLRAEQELRVQAY